MSNTLVATMLISASIVIGFAVAIASSAIAGTCIILGISVGAGLACIAE